MMPSVSWVRIRAIVSSGWQMLPRVKMPNVSSSMWHAGMCSCFLMIPCG